MMVRSSPCPGYPGDEELKLVQDALDAKRNREIAERERVAHAEKTIAALGVEHANKLASLSLLHYRIMCSTKSAGGQFWWHAYSPGGHSMPGHGGLDIRNVIDRVWLTAEAHQ